MKPLSFFMLILLATTTHAQELSSPDFILSKVSQKLNSLKTIKYTNTRELSFPSEKYYYNSVWTSYYDFGSVDTLTNFKYEVEDSALKQIFNGTEKFVLDKKAKTIQINDHPAKKDFNTLSFLYNSIITLKHILPLLINDKDATKTYTDTSINRAPYFLVTINIGKRRIQYLGKGFDTMKTNYNFIYKVVIQKSNYLPYEVLQANDENTDFIKTTFDNIKINSNSPSELSWYYTTYTKDYKKAVDKNIPALAAIGSVAPQWNLKLHNSGGKTISLNDLKG